MPIQTEEIRKKTVKECLIELAAAFRVFEVSEPMLKAYWAALGEFDCARIRSAFEQAIKLEAFWPAPARVRRYAQANVAQLYPELQEIGKL